MLVHEDVVEASRVLRIADSADLLHLRRVGQVGHVEDHGAQIGVGAAGEELHRLHEVVAAVVLEVLGVQRADSSVQLGVLDSPLVDDARAPRI